MKKGIIVFVMLMSAQVFSESPDAHSDKLLQNPDKTSYPQIILNIMKWVPRWQANTDLTSDCKLSLNQSVLQPDQCLATEPLNFFDSFRSKLFFDFDAEGLWGFEPIDFMMTKTLKVRGLLGLHRNQVRPLVIFRMGVHGNRDEFMAERFLIKILFQDLGYHVLMLESLTSHGFLMSNEQVSFGGLEEGLHTFFVLNQIRKKELPWVSQISKIHLVALSMGGAGAFLTTYLDEQTFHQISSVQVFCPLLNLKSNFDRLLQPGWANALGDLWNHHRMRVIKPRIPELQAVNWWNMLLDQRPHFVPTLMDVLEKKDNLPLLSLAEFQKHFPDVKFPAEFIQHLKQHPHFLESNDFWPIFKNEKTPIQVVSTPHDRLVINELNSDRIRNHSQPGIYKKTQLQELKGFHCALTEEYQWPFLVEFVRRGLETP